MQTKLQNQSQHLHHELDHLHLQPNQTAIRQTQQQHMIANKLQSILSKIQSIRQLNKISYPVRLVAVSKTKTVQEIMQAYDAGQRHFGQNYVDQIEQKHLKLPKDINWHFIGHLQSNKIKKVIVPNLYLIQTIDRQSLAQKIQKYLAKQEPNRILNILIQVKTSEQQSKNGCSIAELDNLYDYVAKECPNLSFKGLMTIGKEGDMMVFQQMEELKRKMCEKYKLKEEEFELSMGMSSDFEIAEPFNQCTSGKFNIRCQKLWEQRQDRGGKSLIEPIEKIKMISIKLNGTIGNLYLKAIN